MDAGEFGALLRGAEEYRQMILDGLTVRPDEIFADEYYALRVIREEQPAPKPPDE